MKPKESTLNGRSDQMLLLGLIMDQHLNQTSVCSTRNGIIFQMKLQHGKLNAQGSVENSATAGKTWASTTGQKSAREDQNKHSPNKDSQVVLDFPWGNGSLHPFPTKHQ